MADSGAPDGAKRVLGFAVLLATGVGLGVITIVHGISPGEPFLSRLLSLAALVGLALPLIGGSYWLWRRDVSSDHVLRVAGWGLSGAVPITLLALVTVLYQRSQGVYLADTWTIVLWIAGAGMVGGAVTGVYDVRRERARENARTTAERLQTIFQTVPIPLVVRDADGIVLQWNRAAEEVFGWEAEEVRGEPYPLVPNDRQAEYREYRTRVRGGDDVRGVETKRERMDGSKVDVQIWSARLPDETGQQDETILALPDITDLKERERSLKTLQEVGRKLVRARTPDTVFDHVIDAVGRLFDEPLAGCWKYDDGADALRPMCQSASATELVGEPPTFEGGESLAWKAYESGERAVYDDVRDADAVFSTDTPMRSEVILPLGELGILIISATEPGAFDQIDVDIADALAAAAETALERIQREDDLRLFQRAVEETGHAVAIIERDGTIRYVNPAFEEQTGYTRAEAVGASTRIVRSDKHDEESEEMWKTIASGEVWEAELVNEHKSGELYQVEQTVAPITNDEGEITHVVSIESDITDRRLREQRLSVLNRVLRHNLRNSLTVITGNANFLLERLDETGLREKAAAIVERTEALNVIGEKAGDVHEFFQREGDTSSSIDLSEALEEVEDELQATFPEAEIECHVDGPLPVAADDMLRVAIEEVVENAVVHNDHPEPEVVITVTEGTADGDQVTIEIVDNGPGIPEQERTMLELGEETPLFHGSGIGLWLVYWILTEFGGDVTITERDERGSVVVLSLPRVDQNEVAGVGQPE